MGVKLDRYDDKAEWKKLGKTESAEMHDTRLKQEAKDISSRQQMTTAQAMMENAAKATEKSKGREIDIKDGAIFGKKEKPAISETKTEPGKENTARDTAEKQYVKEKDTHRKFEQVIKSNIHQSDRAPKEKPHESRSTNADTAPRHPAQTKKGPEAVVGQGMRDLADQLKNAKDGKELPKKKPDADLQSGLKSAAHETKEKSGVKADTAQNREVGENPQEKAKTKAGSDVAVNQGSVEHQKKEGKKKSSGKSDNVDRAEKKKGKSGLYSGSSSVRQTTSELNNLLDGRLGDLEEGQVDIEGDAAVVASEPVAVATGEVRFTEVRGQESFDYVRENALLHEKGTIKAKKEKGVQQKNWESAPLSKRIEAIASSTEEEIELARLFIEKMQSGMKDPHGIGIVA